jgi:hypothetical protein
MIALREALKRVRPVMIGFVAARSYLDSRKWESGNVESETGNTTVHQPIDGALRHIRKNFSDFTTYGKLSESNIAGKRILELGPGDNLAMGVLFQAMGAASYVGIDRFYSPRDNERERLIYLKLNDDLPKAQQDRLREALDLSEGIRFSPERIRAIYGPGAEKASESLEAGSVDLLISSGVLQSVRLKEALPGMMRLLAPGGTMIHRFDLRDLGMLSSNGYHPLEFLTISAGTYKWIEKGADRSNRMRVSHYREALEGSGLRTKVFYTAVYHPDGAEYTRFLEPYPEALREGIHYDAGQIQFIEKIRKRLAPEFREIPAAELVAAGLLVIATKDGASS